MNLEYGQQTSPQTSYFLLYIMIRLFQRKGNSSHSSYSSCRLILKKADLQKINSNKNIMQKVMDLLFERQLFKGWGDRMPDLLLHLNNFTKFALLEQYTKQQFLKRYLQWL
jgi:hypothetical protein